MPEYIRSWRWKPTVQGVLIQDNEGEFYVRPTIDEDIRETTENRSFLTTPCKERTYSHSDRGKNLKTTKKEELRDLVLPENVEAITWLLSSDNDFPLLRGFHASNGKEVFARSGKEKGNKNQNYPLS